jgi:hypothetical protein
MHAVRFVVSRGAIALVVLLTGCAGAGVAGTGGIAAPPAAGLRISPEAGKGNGVYGVSFDDLVDINGAQKHDCSGPSSYCSEFVKKEEAKDQLSISHSNSVAKLAASIALGRLSGSSEIDRHAVGGGTVIAIKWEDTFTITSKKLPAKTPVSLKATLQIAGKPADCMGNGTGYFWASEQLSITTTYSGLEYISECAPPQKVLKATVKSYVGASFTESEIYDVDLGVDPYKQSCPSCKLDFKYESGTLTATYHLEPITSGASYITASGKSYL